MATPKQKRRRARFALLAALILGALTATAIAIAAVKTDQYYYSPGQTVQITGDNMSANENVTVDVVYPDGSLAQEHQVAADGSGDFADSYTIQSSDPAGVYTVNATGNTSANSFTTTFDPAVQADCLQFDNQGHFDPVTPSASVDSDGSSIDITWTDQCTNEEHYIVQRSTTGTDPWTDIATLDPGTTSYKDTSATCGTSYYYRIEAVISNPGADHQTSFSDVSSAVEVTCHPTQVATTIYLKGTSSYSAVTGAIALGSIVRDSATVSVTDGSGLTPTGKVAFTFYKSSACAPGTNNGNVLTTEPDVALSSGSATSSDSSALGAGSYGYVADYTADSPFTGSTGSCEPLTVNQATPTVATEIRDANGNAITSVAPGTTIHDHATVTGVTGFTPTGTVDFTLYPGSSCGGTPLKQDTGGTADTLSGGATDSSTYTIPMSTTGSISYLAHYNGDKNYNGASAGCEVLSVLPQALVTNSSLCTFDTNSTQTGSQFRLIYTPDGTGYWKLSASNPGQFYYNVFLAGPLTTSKTVTLTIPAPFVTQGAVPIHVYAGATVTSPTTGTSCITPGTEIANNNQQLTNGGQVTVTVPATTASLVYINIHLDFGLKGKTGYSKQTDATGCNKTAGTDNDAISTTGNPNVCDNTQYPFSNDVAGSTTSNVQNNNVFKNDPGIGGLILSKSDGSPIVGATVQIYDSNNKLLGTVTTDGDGWYMWAYKYTGKAATFTVKLPAYNATQTVTLKSNGFLVVNFNS